MIMGSSVMCRSTDVQTPHPVLDPRQLSLGRRDRLRQPPPDHRGGAPRGAALRVIDQWVAANSQFIIATHSPMLLAYPHAKIVRFDVSGVHEMAFEDTEHFVVTRDFLNHYPKRPEQLSRDDDDTAS
jgi:hypothetical protein